MEHPDGELSDSSFMRVSMLLMLPHTAIESLAITGLTFFCRISIID